MAYRILSLDGGGAWALIEVRALIALYGAATKGQAVLADFDMVAANSGGSLVLGGLVENLALSDLLGYFEDERKRKSVFSPSQSFGDRVLHDLTGIGPKYSADAKLPAIQRLMPSRGDIALTAAAAGIRRRGAAVDIHLLVIGFDYDRNRAKFFRSATAGSSAIAGANNPPQWGQGDTSNATLADAIHASTNAPVNYFDGPARFPEKTGRYWDGGLTGCNNPVLAAVTEAITLDVKPTDIVALSLGTGNVALPWPQQGQAASPYLQKPSELGVVSDLRKLATAILDDPPDIASFLAHVMTGSGSGVPAPTQSRIVRMNPLVSPTHDLSGTIWGAPSGMTAAQFSYLVNLDMDATDQPQVDAISEFADLWLANKVANQPIRMDGDTLRPELGDAWFSNAVASWNAVKNL
jgi:hypothetical protein